MHIWEKAALLALSFTLLWGAWAQGRQAGIAAGVLRLHVIAVSDDAEEQAQKLAESLKGTVSWLALDGERIVATSVS